MRALVEQHAAAFAGPCRAPTAQLVIRLGAKPVRDDPVDPANPAEFATLDEFVDFFVARVGALLEHDGKDKLRVLLCGDESFPIGFMGGNRFLHEHVQAALQRVDAADSVIEVRCCNEHGINGIRTNQTRYCE